MTSTDTPEPPPSTAGIIAFSWWACSPALLLTFIDVVHGSSSRAHPPSFVAVAMLLTVVGLSASAVLWASVAVDRPSTRRATATTWATRILVALLYVTMTLLPGAVLLMGGDASLKGGLVVTLLLSLNWLPALLLSNRWGGKQATTHLLTSLPLRTRVFALGLLLFGGTLLASLNTVGAAVVAHASTLQALVALIGIVATSTAALTLFCAVLAGRTWAGRSVSWRHAWMVVVALIVAIHLRFGSLGFAWCSVHQLLSLGGGVLALAIAVSGEKSHHTAGDALRPTDVAVLVLGLLFAFAAKRLSLDVFVAMAVTLVRGHQPHFGDMAHQTALFAIGLVAYFAARHAATSRAAFALSGLACLSVVVVGEMAPAPSLGVRMRLPPHGQPLAVLLMGLAALGLLLRRHRASFGGSPFVSLRAWAQCGVLMFLLLSRASVKSGVTTFGLTMGSYDNHVFLTQLTNGALFCAAVWIFLRMGHRARGMPADLRADRWVWWVVAVAITLQSAARVIAVSDNLSGGVWVWQLSWALGSVLVVVVARRVLEVDWASLKPHLPAPTRPVGGEDCDAGAPLRATAIAQLVAMSMWLAVPMVLWSTYLATRALRTRAWKPPPPPWPETAQLIAFVVGVLCSLVLVASVMRTDTWARKASTVAHWLLVCCVLLGGLVRMNEAFVDSAAILVWVVLGLVVKGGGAIANARETLTSLSSSARWTWLAIAASTAPSMYALHEMQSWKKLSHQAPSAPWLLGVSTALFAAGFLAVASHFLVVRARRAVASPLWPMVVVIVGLVSATLSMLAWRYPYASGFDVFALGVRREVSPFVFRWASLAFVVALSPLGVLPRTALPSTVDNRNSGSSAAAGRLQMCRMLLVTYNVVAAAVLLRASETLALFTGGARAQLHLVVNSWIVVALCVAGTASASALGRRRGARRATVACAVLTGLIGVVGNLADPAIGAGHVVVVVVLVGASVARRETSSTALASFPALPLFAAAVAVVVLRWRSVAVVGSREHLAGAVLNSWIGNGVVVLCLILLWRMWWMRMQDRRVPAALHQSFVITCVAGALFDFRLFGTLHVPESVVMWRDGWPQQHLLASLLLVVQGVVLARMRVAVAEATPPTTVAAPQDAGEDPAAQDPTGQERVEPVAPDGAPVDADATWLYSDETDARFPNFARASATVDVIANARKAAWSTSWTLRGWALGTALLWVGVVPAAGGLLHVPHLDWLGGVAALLFAASMAVTLFSLPRHLRRLRSDITASGGGVAYWQTSPRWVRWLFAPVVLLDWQANVKSLALAADIRPGSDVWLLSHAIAPFVIAGAFYVVPPVVVACGAATWLLVHTYLVESMLVNLHLGVLLLPAKSTSDVDDTADGGGAE